MMRRAVITVIFGCLAALLSMTVSATELDSTFGADGVVLIKPIGVSLTGLQIAEQSTGKLIVAYAYVSGNIGRWAVMRLNSNGTLDPTFGTGSLTTITIPGQLGLTLAGMALDSADGIVLAGGSTDFGTNTGIALAKLNANGALDTSFDTDGMAVIDSNGTFKEVFSAFVATGESNAIYLAGALSFSGTLWKVTNAGALDTGFDGDGRYTTAGATASSLNGVTVDVNGRVVAVGYYLPGEDAVVARLSSAGVPHTGFDSDGFMSFPFDNFSTFLAMHVDTDASANITFTGVVSDGLLTARVTSAGALDSAFAGDGTALIDFDSDTESVRGMQLDSSNRPVLAAMAMTGDSFDQETGLVRLTTTGVPDSGFGSNGKFGVDIFGYGDEPHDLHILSTGEYLIVGLTGTSPFEFGSSLGLISVIKVNPASGSGAGNNKAPWLSNTGFESGSGDPGGALSWTGVNLTSDKRSCDKPAKNKYFSFTGTCAFVFIGGTAENAVLKQSVSNFGATIIEVGDVLGYSVHLKAPAQINLRLKVKVTFTAGGKATPINTLFAAPLPDYVRFNEDGFVATADIKKIQVMLTSKSLSGKTYVDNLILWQSGEFFAPLRGMREVLPAPAAPSGFRLAGG